MKIYNITALILIVITLLSCEKEEQNTTRLSRMFMPKSFLITEEDASVEVSWQLPQFTKGREQELSFTVEASQDPSFLNEITFHKVVDSLRISLGASELSPGGVYYVRIKTNALGSASDSKWLLSDPFSLPE